jgi:hypothetical protein
MTWAILDQLPPDAMPDKTRFLLGGLIAGGLLEVYRMYHEGAPTPDPPASPLLKRSGEDDPHFRGGRYLT